MSDNVKERDDKDRSSRSTGSRRDSTTKSRSSAAAVTSSSTALTPVEEMYRIYEKINAATDKSGLEKEYRVFLGSVNKSENEKRLASQFIPRFLDSFPTLGQEAFDALLDLCEDDDTMIRRQVIKDVVTACQKAPTFVPKIADVLGQLMDTADNNELPIIERTLTSLFHIDPQGAMVGLFNQISHGDAVGKQRCVKLLAEKVSDLGPEIITPAFEIKLFDESRRVLNDADPETFKAIIKILYGTKYLKQLNGQQALIDTFTEVCTLENLGDDEKNIQRLIVVTNVALDIFSTKISPNNFIDFYVTKVLDELPRIGELPNGKDLRFELFKQMANCIYTLTRITDDKSKEYSSIILTHLKNHLPLPPESGEPNVELEYGVIECLLFALHKLGIFLPTFLMEEPGRLTDLRRRLQYCSRGTQILMRKLRIELQDKKGEELQTDNFRFKMMSNTNGMIRDMFHNPPTFNLHVVPSWKPLAKSNILKRALKVKAEMIGLSPTKIPRFERGLQVYQPPTGRYSQRGGRFGMPKSPRGPGGGSRYRGSSGPSYRYHR